MWTLTGMEKARARNQPKPPNTQRVRIVPAVSTFIGSSFLSFVSIRSAQHSGSAARLRPGRASSAASRCWAASSHYALAGDPSLAELPHGLVGRVLHVPCVRDGEPLGKEAPYSTER